jgi:hypothetical protein
MSARDSHFHIVKRKYLNPGFQPRALHNYEGRLIQGILTLKEVFLNKTSSGPATLNWNEWCKSDYLTGVCYADFVSEILLLRCYLEVPQTPQPQYDKI